MTPEAIVQETPETIQIPIHSVQEFTIKKIVTVSGEDGEWTTESWDVLIRAKNGSYTFLSRADPSSQVENNPSIIAILGNIYHTL